METSDTGGQQYNSDFLWLYVLGRSCLLIAGDEQRHKGELSTETVKKKKVMLQVQQMNENVSPDS